MDEQKLKGNKNNNNSIDFKGNKKGIERECNEI